MVNAYLITGVDSVVLIWFWFLCQKSEKEIIQLQMIMSNMPRVSVCQALSVRPVYRAIKHLHFVSSSFDFFLLVVVFRTFFLNYLTFTHSSIFWGTPMMAFHPEGGGYSNYFLTGCAVRGLKPLPISKDSPPPGALIYQSDVQVPPQT